MSFISFSKYLSILLLLISTFSSQSQVVSKSFTKNHHKINLSNSVDNWMVSVQALDMGKPGGDSYNNFLLKQKEKNSLKFPRIKKYKFSTIKNSALDSIIKIKSGFEGNLYNNRMPNDNTLAISNDGILLAGINSSYIIYDTKNDSLLKSGTLQSMTLDFTSLRFQSKYDPKFIYDPDEDRFIMVFLVGKNPSASHVCVAFSNTNDPLGDWNVYMLVGDALNTGHWTDYPAISLTKDDLFITGNLLLNGVSWQLGFFQSIIWQVDKQSGYNGADSLSFNLWSEFKDDSIYIRNIHPVRGARELQDKKQYFLSNKNFSVESDTLYLMKIQTDRISSKLSSSTKKLSLPDHYFLSPNGQQYNGQELSTNDSRVLGGIIDEDWIQFVNHSMDTSTGTCGIYHGTIYNYNSNNPFIESKIISDSILDLGYPNIVSTGINYNETECIIGFNFTSVVDTNGMACVYFKEDEYSGIKKLHTGEKAIDRLSGNIERWGDYSGIQRKYDQPCKVWLSGMYGKFNTNGSWISCISVADSCRRPDDAVRPIFTSNEFNELNRESFESKIFPNPSFNLSYFEFKVEKEQKIKIELFSINGELVNTLFNNVVKKGNNRLAFNISHLNNGSYIVTIKNQNGKVFTKKLIKR